MRKPRTRRELLDLLGKAVDSNSELRILRRWDERSERPRAHTTANVFGAMLFDLLVDFAPQEVALEVQGLFEEHELEGALDPMTDLVRRHAPEAHVKDAKVWSFLLMARTKSERKNVVRLLGKI